MQNVNLVPCPHGGRCGRNQHIAGSAAYKQCLDRVNDQVVSRPRLSDASANHGFPQAVGELFGDQSRLSEDGKVEWSFRGAGQEKVDTKMSYDEDGRLFMTVSVDIGSVPGMHDSKPPRNSEVFRDIMKSYGLQVESKPVKMTPTSSSQSLTRTSSWRMQRKRRRTCICSHEKTQQMLGLSTWNTDEVAALADRETRKRPREAVN